MRTVVLLMALCGVVTGLPFESMRSKGWNIYHDPSLLVDTVHFPADPIFGGADTYTDFSSYTLDPVLDQDPPTSAVRGNGPLVSSYKCQLACDVNPACGIALWNSLGTFQCWLIDAQKITSKQRIVKDYDPAVYPHWNLFRHVDRIDANANLIPQVVTSDAQLPFHRFWDFSTPDDPLLNDTEIFFSSHVTGCDMIWDNALSAWHFKDRAIDNSPVCWFQVKVPDNLLTKPWRLEMTVKFDSSIYTSPYFGLFAFLGGMTGKRIDAPAILGFTDNLDTAFQTVQWQYFPQLARVTLSNINGQSTGDDPIGGDPRGVAGLTKNRVDLGLTQPYILLHRRTPDNSIDMYIKTLRLIAFEDQAQDRAARVQASVEIVQQQFDAKFMCASSGTPSSMARWCRLRAT